jgi:biotin carboxyl carrier protein
MRVEVEYEGRLHSVEIQPLGNSRFEVRIDGVALPLEARRQAGDTLSLRLTDGSTHLVDVQRPFGSGQRTLTIDGQRLQTAVNGRRERRAAAATGGVGTQRVTAPMPGKVIRVLVAPGQQVEARQPLVVVEAMKMENELSVARAGRVAEVQVAEGQSVEAGRLLVLVE